MGNNRAGTGEGTAYDAQVLTQDNVPPAAASSGPMSQEEQDAARKAEGDEKGRQAALEALQEAVAAAERKVEKQQAHLAASEAALEEAKAALAAATD